jgi:hypothetical protein
MPKRRTRLSKLFRIGFSTFALGFAGTVILGTGCGDPSTSHDTTPNPTDTSHADASAPPDLTETEACAAYVLSVCERRNECLGTTDNCLDSIAYCPDLLFAEGSTRSANSTWQCAQVMRSRSCEDVVTGRTADCVSAGTRALGESCIAAAQCDSLQCSGSPLECGRCIARRKHGESCSLALPCVPGLVCGSAGTCVEPSRENLDEKLARAPRALGESCVGTERCVEGTYCKLEGESAVGRCAPEVPLDTECDSTAACGPTAYCSIESMKCRVLPSVGARCGNDISLNVLIWCDAASYCNDETERCTALPSTNEPCATNEQLDEIPTLCDATNYCDQTREPPTCVALEGPGRPCEAGSCRAELTCACEDAACASRTCVRFRGFGESCSDVGDRCPPNISNCVDGRCRPNPSQGLFARMCAPA